MYKGKGNVNSHKGGTNHSGQSGGHLSSAPSSKPTLDMSEASVNHADIGEYTENSNRHRKGGHGQDALDYMDKNGVKYEINIEYNNGVRRGNIPGSKDKMRRTGNTQSWFPKEWSSDDIKNAAIEVSKTFKGAPRNGDKHTGIVKGVSVTIIFGDGGSIKTAYPSKNQPGGIKNDK